MIRMSREGEHDTSTHRGPEACLIQRPGLAAQSDLSFLVTCPSSLSLSFPEVPAPSDISVNTSSVRRPPAASTYAWLSGQVRAVFSHPPGCPDVDGFLLASFCSSTLSPRTRPSPAVEDISLLPDEHLPGHSAVATM